MKWVRRKRLGKSPRQAFLGPAPDHAAVLNEEDNAEQGVPREASSGRGRDAKDIRDADEQEVGEEDERPPARPDGEEDQQAMPP